MVAVKLKNIYNFMRQACFIFFKKNNVTPAIDLTKKKGWHMENIKKNMGTQKKEPYRRLIIKNKSLIINYINIK
jgi:hypothetical protein